MPVYVFASKSGRREERYFPLGKIPDEIEVDGETLVRDLIATHASAKTTRGGKWPILSDAVGVLPSQVGEAKALDNMLGVPTDYTPDGRVEFRSPGHQRAWLKAHKGFNKADYR